MYVDNGNYPSTEEGLNALVQKPADTERFHNWRQDGYLDKSQIPLDPWDNEYIYIFPAKYGDQPMDIYSKGIDGVDNHGEGDDISNWKELTEEQKSGKSKTNRAIDLIIPFTIGIILTFLVVRLGSRENIDTALRLGKFSLRLFLAAVVSAFIFGGCCFITFWIGYAIFSLFVWYHCCAIVGLVYFGLCFKKGIRDRVLFQSAVECLIPLAATIGLFFMLLS